MIDAELTNADWYIKQLTECRSVERLTYLCDAIKYDKWEEEEYTKDEAVMSKLRELREAKLKEFNVT